MTRKEWKWKEIKENECNEEKWDDMKRDEMEGVERKWKKMIGAQRKWLTNKRRSMEMTQNDRKWEKWKWIKETIGNEVIWMEMKGKDRIKEWKWKETKEDDGRWTGMWWNEEIWNKMDRNDRKSKVM